METTKKKAKKKATKAATKTTSVKKAGIKKTSSKKAANKKAVNKTVAKKAATKKTASGSNKIKVTLEQHHKMICEAAYYISLNRTHETVNPTEDWLQAETAISKICTIHSK